MDEPAVRFPPFLLSFRHSPLAQLLSLSSSSSVLDDGHGVTTEAPPSFGLEIFSSSTLSKSRLSSKSPLGFLVANLLGRIWLGAQDP